MTSVEMDTPIITFDVDWAPDFIIEEISKIMIEYKIKSTWFITHSSPAIENLKTNLLFELGLHPNFEINSTHGKNPDEVLQFMKKIVPEAKSIRTHKLFQSSHILSLFQNYGIENDSSILLPHVEHISPHYVKYYNLFRFPIFWEDDIEMAVNPDWELNKEELMKSGMKIFNFHPIHIYLNSQNFDKYSLMKKREKLENMNFENVQEFINKDKNGVKTFFEKILQVLDSDTFTIQDIQKKFKNNEN